MAHSLHRNITNLLIKFLRRKVLGSYFKPYSCHTASREASFDFVQDQSCQSSAAIFWSDSESSDMPDTVLFNHSDGECAHLVIFRPDLPRNSVGVREQVTKRLAFVSFTIHKTAHIQLPQLVQIR